MPLNFGLRNTESKKKERQTDVIKFCTIRSILETFLPIEPRLPPKNVFSVWDASVTDIQLSIFENTSAEADGVNMLASAGHVEGMRFFLII